MALRASDRDASADPGVDFYRFANGGWLDANPIPAGYGSWGSFEEVSRRNELTLRELLERAAAEPVDELDRLLGDAFAAGLDVAAIEAAGLESIAPLLREIEAAEDHAAVLALLPTLHRSGVFALFGWGVTVDHDDSDRYLLWLVQSGLGLPDREQYFDAGEAAVELRAAYVEHVAAQLGHVGFDREQAAAVLEFETRLAELHLKAEERRDVELTHNRYTRAELATLDASLAGHLDALGAGAAESVNVQNPRLLGGLAEVVAATAPPTLRAYLAFNVVRGLASALPARIDDEDFAFYGRRIRGQQEQHERTKRVIDAIGEDLGRGARPALRRAHLPARGQGTRRDDGRGDHRGDARVDPDAGMDGRRDAREGRGQARRDPGQDRLSRIAGATGQGSSSPARRTRPTGSTRRASSSTVSSRS